VTKTFRCGSCGGWNRVDLARGAPKCGRCKAPLATGGQVAHVGDAELDGLFAGSPIPVLVDFYADWCGPCKALAPTLAQLAARHAGELVVVKVDTERHGRHAQRLGVQSIPAVFLVAGGRVVDRGSGNLPLPDWERMVAPHLG
jgi:thioredoxin 2